MPSCNGGIGNKNSLVRPFRAYCKEVWLFIASEPSKHGARPKKYLLENSMNIK